MYPCRAVIKKGNVFHIEFARMLGGHSKRDSKKIPRPFLPDRCIIIPVVYKGISWFILSVFI